MAKLGSLQVGSASKFSSKGKPPKGAEYQPNVSDAQLHSPPAPGAYQGLQGGPEFDYELEPNQTTPIDGSRDLLRVLSPFMIQVEPPLIMGATPHSYDAKKDVAGLIAAGHDGAPSAFNSARGKLLNMPGGEHMANAGTVESFVSNGLLHKPEGGASKKVKSKGEKGEEPDEIGTPAIADLYTAVDITMQLRALVNTPPLVLLINPQSLSMSYTKIQQFTDRTRFGYVFQAWGEEQPKLSISARCGAFITSGKGVQFASRRDSASWQNLQTAFQFYRHNGYIYDTVGKSNANHMVGALSIHYDGWVYYGNMESFSYTLEEGNQLGGVVFDMEFTVNAMVDTSKQSMVVTPMRSPVPSGSDRRYGKAAGKASVSKGDLSVGGPDGAVHGGDNNYLKKLALGEGEPEVKTPDGQSAQGSEGQKLPPGGLVSPKSSGGFTKVSPQASAAVDPAQRLPSPFGVGG